MTADPATAFLALARAQRLLPAEELESLARPGELTPERMHELTDRLLAAGELTPYQSQELAAGRGDALVVAGFPIVGQNGDEFQALHPSLGSPVTLRRLPAGRFATEAERNDYVRRAQEASVIRHRHLTTLLDAGVTPDGGVFVATEPVEGADLLTLVGDTGPVPQEVACGYVRGVAAALEVAAGRGLVHGDVQPRNLNVSQPTPTPDPRDDGTPRLRPAADATVKLSGLGLRLDPVADTSFAAPERPLTGAADVYGLGATLHFLLTGRPPVGDAPTLAESRPEVPPALAEAIGAMLHPDPTRRPSLTSVIASLGGEPAAVVVKLDKPAANALADLIDDALAHNVALQTPVDLLPAVTLPEAAGIEHPLGPVEALEVLEGDPPVTSEEAFVPREYAAGESGEAAFATVAPLVASGGHPEPLAHDEPLREKVELSRNQIWLRVGLGVGLNLFALLLLIAWRYNLFDETKPPGDAKPPAKKSTK